jgi:hypothetical protein
MKSEIADELKRLGCSSVSDKLISRWRDHLGEVSPAEFFSFIAELDLSPAKLEFATPPGSSLQLTLDCTQNDLPVLKMQRVFSYIGQPPVKRVELKLLEIHPSFQNQGLLGLILGTHIPCFQKAQIRRLELTANISVGGYAFARYGFKVLHDEYGHNVEGLREQVENNLERVPEAFRDQAREILAKVDWHDAWVASDLAELPFGRELLLETDWDAYLDLTDSEQVETVRRAIDLKAESTYPG